VGSSRDGFWSSADWSITWAPGQKARKACTGRRHGYTRLQAWLATRNCAVRTNPKSQLLEFSAPLPEQPSRHALSSFRCVLIPYPSCWISEEFPAEQPLPEQTLRHTNSFHHSKNYAHRHSPPAKLYKTPV